MKFGIQGGKGSFNEEAVRHYLKKEGIPDCEIVYLYTSDAVMNALCKGTIDRGQCAIYNSTGGYVEETTDALEKYPVHVVEEFEITIAHALMIHPEAAFERIDTIMCHPQVFAQCRKTLAEKYGTLRQVSGTGDLIDNAKAAEALETGQIGLNHAVMGSKILADIYNLTIIEDNLQDLGTQNFTRFLHAVKKD